MAISALYARVSTSGQENEQTIEAQINEIKTRIKADGNDLAPKSTFIDNGWSGELLARPALDSLRDAVKNKTFEVLYLYDLGRLSRNFLNQLILKKEIIEAGIQIISLHDINGVNPETLLAQNVMGLFHDYERIKITEQFRRGKLYKAQSGILFGWQAPYGYKYIKGVDVNTGHFEINDSEAETVKKMFAWVAEEGLTIRQLINKLYINSMKPRKSKHDYWSTSTLSKRLRDKTYIGTTYYNKTQSIVAKNPLKEKQYKRTTKTSRIMKPIKDWYSIKVPQIIDVELFNKVQKQLTLNDRFAIRNKKSKYLISNLIDCTCGATRAGEGISGTNNLYYRCTDRVRQYPLPRQCFHKGVNAPILDNMVWERLTKLLTNPKLVKKYYSRWIKEKISSPNAKKIDDQNFKQEIKTLNDQDQRYLEAYGRGVITLEQYKEQSSSIKLTIKDYINKLRPSNADVREKIIEIPDYEVVYDKMKSTLDDYGFDKRRLVVKRIVTNVVTDGNTATMTGLLPLEINEKSKENVEFKTFNRDSMNTMPQSLPFSLTFKVPDPRKRREILKRDSIGRIIHTKPC